MAAESIKLSSYYLLRAYLCIFSKISHIIINSPLFRQRAYNYIIGS